MTKIRNPKPVYDLEERTLQFAKDVKLFLKNQNNLNSKFPCSAVFWSLGIGI